MGRSKYCVVWRRFDTCSDRWDRFTGGTTKPTGHFFFLNKLLLKYISKFTRTVIKFQPKPYIKVKLKLISTHQRQSWRERRWRRSRSTRAWPSCRSASGRKTRLRLDRWPPMCDAHMVTSMPGHNTASSTPAWARAWPTQGPLWQAMAEKWTL